MENSNGHPFLNGGPIGEAQPSIAASDSRDTEMTSLSGQLVAVLIATTYANLRATI